VGCDSRTIRRRFTAPSRRARHFGEPLARRRRGRGASVDEAGNAARKRTPDALRPVAPPGLGERTRWEAESGMRRCARRAAGELPELLQQPQVRRDRPASKLRLCLGVASRRGCSARYNGPAVKDANSSTFERVRQLPGARRRIGAPDSGLPYARAARLSPSEARRQRRRALPRRDWRALHRRDRPRPRRRTPPTRSPMCARASTAR